MKIREVLVEQIVDEMPLPADWDKTQFGHDSTFKKRLAYTLDRAKKLGTGSSRVATVIDYQGRPTVLKIAKNKKGLAQNAVEADILDDGYARQLDILIPLIDYDTENREPTWIHTEMATKVNEKQLCSIFKCENLSQLINMAWAISGKKKYVGNYQSYVSHLLSKGRSQEDIDTMTEYANTLVDLNNSFDVELGDLGRAANWGMYQGKPVIVDAGFNSSVMQQYYSESKHLKENAKAEAYKAHLLKTLPIIMGFFKKVIRDWHPTEEQMLDAIEIAYEVMKQTGDVKVAGKALQDHLNKLHKMSQGVAEGKNSRI